MHVDDVRDGAQLLDGFQRAPPLDARLQREQEEHARPHQHDVVDARLQHLDELERIQRLLGRMQRDARVGQPRGDDRDEQRHQDAQAEDGPPDPFRALARQRGDAVQLAADAGEAGSGEALLDAAAQQRDRLGDGIGVEDEIGHVETRRYASASGRVKGRARSAEL